MSLFSSGHVLPVGAPARLAPVPSMIAGAGALLLSWSQSAAVGLWATATMVALMAVTAAAAALRRGDNRLHTILREEVDACPANHDPAARSRRR